MHCKIVLSIFIIKIINFCYIFQRKKLLESKALEKKKKKLLDGADGEPVTKKKKKKNPQKLL